MMATMKNTTKLSSYTAKEIATKTEYASKQLEAMTVGFTKIVNGKSVTRWSVNRWEVGTFGKNDAMNLTETLVELGFDVE